MSTIVKLAWRNIWRNKRRTSITVTSIVLAVLLSAFMVSIQKGAWDKMIDNVVNFYYGYAQIHTQGYWEDKSIDEAFTLDDQFLKDNEELSEVKALVPRLESFSLAAYGQQTTGVLVVGTEPSAEDKMTQLKSRLVEGEYFLADEDAVLVAQGISEKMNLSIGDTIILISQGYHGVNAAGKYPVKGILKFGSPDLNKQLVYMPLKTAQYFFGAENLVTTVALDIEDRDDVNSAVLNLKSKLDINDYEVMTWSDLMPELVQAREVDAAGNYIILLVLYIIIGFGIFGTILMMTKEREYEFGVLISIGMNRLKLFASVYLEIIFMGLVGAALGILLSYPLCYYFNVNPLDFSNMGEGMTETYDKFGFEPIFPAAMDSMIFINQANIIFIITSILAIYPLIKILKLDPVSSMRD